MLKKKFVRGVLSILNLVSVLWFVLFQISLSRNTKIMKVKDIYIRDS